MSYSPTIDFLALVRRTSNGARAAEMPGLDYMVSAFARAGMFELSVGQVAPTSNQAATAWLKPSLQSWAEEGTLYLWDAGVGAYAEATLALWQSLFFSAAGPGSLVVQEITAGGPQNVQANANIVLVNQIVSAPITLTMPLSTALTSGSVLISDWKGDSGANNITVNLQGADTYPGGFTSWVIAGDTNSIFLRAIPTKGFAL